MKRLAPIVAGLVFAASAFAADPATESEIRAVQTQLQVIQQEQQTLYQEFQMIQELQRQTLLQSDRTLINYDDAVRERQAREARSSQYASDLNERYARYRMLEERKAPLLARLGQLLQKR